eukprot:GFYU01001905.1.p1 GENE.GFYU01001905.1~~GFYU01001905.1.p1  ORF type:complete len:288 (+),score=40.21 GFYU01001905.1:134-997(+)
MSDLTTGLGKHCAMKECRQIDFLPFKCFQCDQHFCLDHRRSEQHGCVTNGKDVYVPVCPVCSEPVPVKPGDDPNVKVDAHIASGCRKPSTLADGSKPKQNKCTYKGCKKSELIPVNCKTCRQRFCLAHRFEKDHQCGAVVARTQSTSNRAPPTGPFKQNPQAKHPIVEPPPVATRGTAGGPARSLPSAASRARDARTQAATKRAAASAQVASTATIQIRLGNGQVAKGEFSPTDTLENVYKYAQNYVGMSLEQFRLISPLPRTEYKPSATTLQQAGLVPRATLTVTY